MFDITGTNNNYWNDLTVRHFPENCHSSSTLIFNINFRIDLVGCAIVLVCTRHNEFNYSFSALELLNKTDVILISGSCTSVLSAVIVMRK